MNFYLGTHRPHWLGLGIGVRLFVSRVTLVDGPLPRATDPWALDSGGFTEIDREGEWKLSASGYVELVRRFADEVGMMEWAAPQDWMCEVKMLERTGKTVAEHQRLTTENLLELRTLAPELPFVPVLQGWEAGDYLRHVDAYDRAGIDLTAEPLVGVGTVCRRQDSAPAARIVREIAAAGIRAHGFGVKVTGLRSYWDALASCDSMAWSYRARKRALDGEPSCDPARRQHCGNCLHAALEWLEEMIEPLADPAAQPLWKETPCAV